VSGAFMELHGALGPLQEACRTAGFLYADDLMAEPPPVPGVCGGPFTALLRKGRVARRHARFALRVLRMEEGRCLLSRDFSSIPLAFLFPLLRSRRERLFFTVNHNLQWALQRPEERAAFRRLGRAGCRFVFFEFVPEEGLRRLGLEAANGLAIPHPVAPGPFRRRRAGGIETVGVIGEYRPEKGIDELLGRLVTLPWRVLLGLPNAETFRARSPFGSHSKLEIIDTSDPDIYRRTVAECDAIVLNHPPGAYRFRASGLIADAAAAYVAAVARRLPVLEQQVTSPVPVGELFDDLDGLETALKRADARLCEGGYDFEAYCAARSARALAGILDPFRESKNG